MLKRPTKRDHLPTRPREVRRSRQEQARKYEVHLRLLAWPLKPMKPRRQSMATHLLGPAGQCLLMPRPWTSMSLPRQQVPCLKTPLPVEREARVIRTSLPMLLKTLLPEPRRPSQPRRQRVAHLIRRPVLHSLIWTISETRHPLPAQTAVESRTWKMSTPISHSTQKQNNRQQQSVTSDLENSYYQTLPSGHGHHNQPHPSQAPNSRSPVTSGTGTYPP
jgi:hypothetical protein